MGLIEGATRKCEKGGDVTTYKEKTMYWCSWISRNVLQMHILYDLNDIISSRIVLLTSN